MPEPKLETEEDDEDEQTEETESGRVLDGATDDDIEEEIVEEEESEESEGDSDEEEEVETEEVEMPDDDDIEGDDSSDGSLLGGSTFGIPNKVLLALGVGAVLLIVILQYWEVESSTRDYDTEQVEQEVEEGGGEAADQGSLGAGGSRGQYSEQQQDAAIERVFG